MSNWAESQKEVWLGFHFSHYRYYIRPNQKEVILMKVDGWEMSSRRMLIISTGIFVGGVMLSSLMESMDKTRMISSNLEFSREWTERKRSPQSSMFTVPLSEWRFDEEQEESQTFRSSQSNLKIYIYDTLPAKFTDDVIACIKDMASVQDDSTFSPLTTKMADIASLQLFKTYHHRTYDPNQADVFVVPYPHAAHCYCANGWQRACGQVSASEIDEVFSFLKYRNETNADRHLFILSGHQYFMNDKLMKQPFKLLGGNLSPEQVDRRDHGTIVIPYLNDKALFQQVFHVPDTWWTRPRKYAFSFVFGEANHKNSGNDPRRVRLLFRDNWVKRNRTELGGLPVYVRSFKTSAIPKEAVWKGFESYHDSVFCPVLAGDSAQQARFFDVLMAGCIPIVLNFTDTDVRKKLPDSWAIDLPSWYKKHGETTAAVYPFNNKLVDFGIDYDSCVVGVEAKNPLDVMKLPGVMERMLRNEPERIRTIQKSLKNCAVRTAFGMGSNAHRHNDAFAQILRMMEYHLEQTSRTRK